MMQKIDMNEIGFISVIHGKYMVRSSNPENFGHRYKPGFLNSLIKYYVN